MFDPEERFYFWKDYQEKISKLFNDIDDDLCYRFAPYGKTKDKDTPNVKILRNALEHLYDFINAHLDELDAEYSAFDTERFNSQFRFNCWYYGLCPNILQKLNITFGLDIQDIAKFKQSEAVSREDTKQAIELWRQQNISRTT